MKVSAMVSVIPLGAGLSLSKYVAACERILTEAGLDPKLHAHGSNVEGEWDAVMAAVKTCLEEVHDMGAPRIATFLKISTRTDREVSRDAAVESVRKRLEET
jgi:uncharacterized protein (TIGR00106 family)